MKEPIFADAQQMQKEHPDTFEAPTPEELSNLKIKDYVKICAGSERFWVQITQIENEIITGTINNDLVLTHEHGLKDNDLVSFEKKHIYNID